MWCGGVQGGRKSGVHTSGEGVENHFCPILVRSSLARAPIERALLSERGASGFESGFHGGDPANTHAGSERVQVRRQRKVQSGPVLGAHTHLHLPGRLARADLESSLTAGRQGSPLQRGGSRDMRTEENPSCGPRGHAARAVKRADGLPCQNSLPPFARRNVKHS